MFYKNLKKHKKTKQKNLVFDIFANGLSNGKDDLLQKANQCKMFYNFSLSNGALQSGMGFKNFEAIASFDDLKTGHTFDIASKVDQICGIWLDRWFSEELDRYVYQILMLDSANKLWSVPLVDEYDGYVWTSSDKMTAKPLFSCAYRIDNKDAILFFTKNGMLHMNTSADGFYESVPPIISCVVHYDKLFAITNTNRNTLIYKTNLNLTQWTEEENEVVEFLDDRGSFTKLVAFDDYVYLFRENGITKISIYTAKGNFAFTHLYTSPSKIYENSICVCGEKVLFVTRDGLYSFNGNSVAKVTEAFDQILQNCDHANCCCECLNGKYYLATNCTFDDDKQVGCEQADYINNLLLEIDLNDFSYNILRGVDIRSLLAVDNEFMSKICACFYNQNSQHLAELVCSGQMFGSSTEKVWQSVQSDLACQGKRKKIKQIVLTTVSDCQIEVVSDEETKVFDVCGSENEQSIFACVHGSVFSFAFKTNNANCKICKPMVVYDVVE